MPPLRKTLAVWNEKNPDTPIKINYQKLTPGQYHIQLGVSEWDGGKYPNLISQSFILENGLYQDFIKK